jgi:hypothetical protein
LSEKKENKRRNKHSFGTKEYCIVKAQRLAWLGHLERMHEERTTKKITLWKP